MTIRRLLPVTLLAALCLAGPALAQGQQPARIAVANTIHVFNEMQETKDLQNSLQQQARNLKVEDDRRRNELDNIKTTRDRFKTDTPEFNNENQKLVKGSIDYQAWAQLTKVELSRHQKQQRKILFDKVEAAAGEVAKQQGYDLVIAEQKLDFPQLDNPEVSDQQVQAIISSRNLLYTNPRVDITSQIIALLDSRYKPAGGTTPAPAGGAAPAPAPAPTPAPAPQR